MNQGDTGHGRRNLSAAFYKGKKQAVVSGWWLVIGKSLKPGFAFH
jgi:hypothetical protein